VCAGRRALVPVRSDQLGQRLRSAQQPRRLRGRCQVHAVDQRADRVVDRDSDNRRGDRDAGDSSTTPTVRLLVDSRQSHSSNSVTNTEVKNTTATTTTTTTTITTTAPV